MAVRVVSPAEQEIRGRLQVAVQAMQAGRSAQPPTGVGEVVATYDELIGHLRKHCPGDTATIQREVQARTQAQLSG